MPPQLVLVTRMSQKNQNQTKANKKYIEYSEMSKEDLIAMLKKVHANIKELSNSIKELENEVEALRQLLLYGSSPGTSTGYTRGKAYGGRTGGYTRGKGYSGYKYGKYKRTGREAPQPEEGGEEPVEEEEEEEKEPVEEEPKPSEEKPAEKPEKGSS
jgi:hypothetical protein